MKQPEIKSKLPHVGTTIFTVMSALAAEYKALNLSQGFPNFPASPELIALVNEYMKKGFNQYAPMTGVKELREEIAKKTFELYKINYHPDTEITVTSGGTEALFAAISAVVRPGDEAIVFEPAYDSYVPAIELNGGIPVYITLTPPEYKINWQEVKNKISEKTKLIIINTPHNPTGSVLNVSDLQQLADIVNDTDIFLLGDEVYEHIIFDGIPHCSLMTHPVLQERSFVCGSFGKTFHVTGWKVGYCQAPKNLTAEFRKVHQFLTFATFTPVQYALAEFLKKPEHYINLPAFYEAKRNKFLDAVKNSRFSFIPSNGSYFQNLSYSTITDENDYDLAIRLTKEIGVASIPVSVFYHQKNDYKILRFCFAKDDETLEKAGRQLSKL
ncbi:MAG: methionine aminotransferase [Bacteroidia bacterium]|nr:methionine aminotransferase [Bacteroidia bacterium]